jgi:3'-phosphoadenosine 5'-phosphosulfate sulfotransferase (PAPS reductase)/FAD synthetase
MTEKRQFQHGDSLPDTSRSVNRVFVSYPMTETPDVKAARIKAGKPAPLLEFVVGNIRGVLLAGVQGGNGMSDPFKIDSPTCLSFSGGRTSAYMLWRVLQSNNGLPPEAIVCFANTGKEEEATLRFVRDCERHWGVPIRWLEYNECPSGWALTRFDIASRNGEPFEALIRKRNYLPNPVTRFCTVELKIRTIFKFLRDNEWLDDGLDMMIGIRSDEQRRVAKIRAGRNSESKLITNTMPLADAGITVSDISKFWGAQPFNLELPTYMGRTLAGNCDLCFLKPANQVHSLIREKPERAVWWARMEALALASKPSGAVFRSDRPSYAAMLKNATDQADAFGFDPEESGIECFCGD